jgi:hypothetical protein
MNRFLPLALLAFTSCGGAAAAPCKVKPNGDGTRTITCSGGSVVVPDAEGSCTLSSLDTGGKRIQCSDGTVVELDRDGSPCLPGPGGLTGVATLFGESSSAGTVVRAERSGEKTTTGSDGGWQLKDLCAGIVSLVFEHEGFAPQRVANQPAVGDPWSVPPVELVRGTLLTADVPYAILAPHGDAVAIQRGQAELDLHRLQDNTSSALTLSLRGTPSFTADGAFLVFTDDHDPADDSVRVTAVEVKDGEPHRPDPERASFAMLQPGTGKVILGRATPAGDPALSRWDPVTGEEVALGGTSDAGSVRVLVGLVVFLDQGKLTFVNDRGSLELPGGTASYVVSADGSAVTYWMNVGELWYARPGSVDPVQLAAQPYSGMNLAPDGSTLFFTTDLGKAATWRPGDAAPTELDAGSITGVSFSASAPYALVAVDYQRLWLVHLTDGSAVQVPDRYAYFTLDGTALLARLSTGVSLLGLGPELPETPLGADLNAVLQSSVGPQLVLVHTNGTADLFDRVTGARQPLGSLTSNILISAGRAAYGSQQDGTIGMQILELDGGALHSVPDATPVAVAGDGTFVVSGLSARRAGVADAAASEARWLDHDLQLLGSTEHFLVYRVDPVQPSDGAKGPPPRSGIYFAPLH